MNLLISWGMQKRLTFYLSCVDSIFANNLIFIQYATKKTIAEKVKQ